VSTGDYPRGEKIPFLSISANQNNLHSRDPLEGFGPFCISGFYSLLVPVRLIDNVTWFELDGRTGITFYTCWC
jgi:hypothetical protein